MVQLDHLTMDYSLTRSCVWACTSLQASSWLY